METYNTMSSVRAKISTPSPAFSGKHQPRNFSSMMNYIYKQAFSNNTDIFESTSSIIVSTKMKNGKDVSGTANFINGKFVSLVLDENGQHIKSKFMQETMNKYIEKISGKRIKNKR